MARVTYSGLITDITGKIGGTVLQKNRSGNIIRVNTLPSKSTTSKQQPVYANNQTFINRWQSLTLTQQVAWNDFADLYTKVNRFGQTKKQSGFNWFVHINSNRLLTGNSLTNTPPTYLAPVGVDTFTVSISDTYLKAVWASPFDASTLYLYIFATSFQKQPSNSNRGKWRLIKIADPDTYSEIDILSEYENYFGLDIPSAASGSKIYISLLIQPINRSKFIGGAGFKAIGSL